MTLFHQNSRSWKLLILLILVSVASACVEEIEIQAGESITENLIIEGQITNELTRHEVKITRSSQFVSQSPPEPVTGMRVTIAAPNRTHVLTELTPGHYFTDSIAGVPGIAYTLQVTGEGQVYQATDLMPEIPDDFEPATFTLQRDFLDYEFRRHQFGFPEPNYWELHIFREDFPEFEIDWESLGKQVGVEVDENLTYTFTYYTHPTIEVNGLLDFEIPHYFGFNSNFEVLHKRFGLSATYYEFLRAVFMETEWRGTLFPSAPGNIRGNVSEGAFGYFRAMSVREKWYEP